MNENQKELYDLLSEGRFIDYTMVFLIGKRLLKPYKKWPAFKMGLINDKGEVIRKPQTSEEKAALTLLDRFILQIKRLVTPKNLLLLTGFFLLKDSLDWEDIQAMDDKQLMERIEKNEKVKEVIEKFQKDINENFGSEEEFWSEFLKLR